MFVGRQKLVVQQQTPDCMHEFTSAVGKYIRGGCMAGQRFEEVMECVRELQTSEGRMIRI
jgi:hypothetical protein